MALSFPSLRVILAVAFGGIALLAALATSLLAGNEARRRVEAQQRALLESVASRFADRLDLGLATRWRDLEMAAGLPQMRDPGAPVEARRGILQNLHDTAAGYALLALVAPDGRVVADSRRLTEGQDASGWPGVRAGLSGPAIEDVHDAPIPEGVSGQGERLRPLDLAVPVRGPDGELLGVVVARLDRRWAAELIGTPLPGEPEILILSRSGEVLLGPAARLGRGVAEGPGAAGFVTGVRATQGTLQGATEGGRRHPDPGWQVVARQPAARAMARSVRRDLLLLGLGTAVLAALLGWVVAGWLARPLRQLAEAAARRRHEGGRDPLPADAGFAEVRTLAAAFDGLLGDCRRSEAALRDSEQRLRLAQRAGHVGAYDWDLAADRSRVTREYAAMHGLAALADSQVRTGAWQDLLSRVHPGDRAALAERVAQALATAGPYTFEYRLTLPDGRTRWIADRGEILPGPDGRPARAIGAIRDITGRRAAEDALRESETRLRLAQEAGGIGSWDLDLATHRQVWSDHQYALFGLDPALPPPDGAAWIGLLHPADRAAMMAERNAALATAEGAFNVEFRIRRASDGALRWVAATGRVLRDAGGRPVRMLGVNRDITEAREREAALRAREAELRAMVEANPIGVLRGDIHGRILDANDALLRIVGRDRGALDAGTLRWDDLTPPEWRQMDADGPAEGPPRSVRTPYERDCQRPDGSRVPVLIGCALVGERHEEAVAFILDLTDRKRAEAALLADKAALERAVTERTAELAARERDLRRIYDRTPTPFHSADTEGRLVRVSDEWLAFLGYRREQVLGRRTGEFMLPESAVRWEAALAELHAGGEEVREVEYRMLRADGRVVDMLLRARAEHDAEGRFIHSYSVLFDMTERNRAEARLREAQKLEGLGRIAGGVAHDFNNLLQVLTGALQMLTSHAGNRARVERYAGIALQAAERGAGLTRRLLAFARQDQLQTGPVHLPELLQGLATLLHGPLGAGVRLDITAPPDLPPVQADRMQLELVLFNLALNARDAMPQGGRLRLEARTETAAGAAAQDLGPGSYLRIQVADTGEGMDHATLERAAEPFFTTKEVGQGTGLGLSMAHGFALQSGGLLRIESAPGEGTVVTLWLPRADAAALPPPSDAAG